MPDWNDVRVRELKCAATFALETRPKAKEFAELLRVTVMRLCASDNPKVPNARGRAS